jgi:hypothetical protein
MTHLIIKVTGLQRWYLTACKKRFDITFNSEDKFTTNIEYVTCEKCKAARLQKN